MRRVPAAALVVVLSTTGACAADEPGPPTPSAAATFTNPVHQENFPDPGVIGADGTWYAYGTNDTATNVPVLTSTDLVAWTPAGDALPEVGGWASRGNTWAPEVIRTAAGGFVLYYTARSTSTGRQCIGAAVADGPRGPFVDRAAGPLVCEPAEGGSIDASPYRDDDGALYLYWKNDGNAVDRPTHLYGRRLRADGLALTGPRVRLLDNDAPWEGHLVEAPQMVRHDDRRYLFFSANAFDSEAYAVGYATCEAALGPCRDAPENPVLRSTAAAAGPGHSFLLTAGDGSTWLLYHAWAPQAVGSVVPGRQLWLDRVDWADGRPVVRGPTADPQPLPG
jgi:beta-xylosidase